MPLLPGQEIFLHRSGLERRSNARLAVLTILVFSLGTIAFFRAFDGLFVGSTLVSQALVMASGQLLVAVMILNRGKFKARWSSQAFSRAFRWLAIPGLTMILTGLAHFLWIEGERILPLSVSLLPVAYLLISGGLLWLRAVQVFGLDNLSLLYVYFPQDSRLVQADVYSVLRHPVYSAILRIVFALILLNGSVFALFAGLVAPLTMTLWLRWAEETELIERFGESYRQYRKHVPAFFNPNPQTWPLLWRFLLRIG